MRCPLCDAENDAAAEACFTCGRAFDALTHGFVLSGRYEVRRPVGSGGMGRVYEAFDRVLEEPVAIKVLRAELTGDPEVARRFLHEIKLARRISHPRVCRIHEYGEAPGIAYISMEFIAGRSLKEELAVRRPTLSEAFALSIQIAEGLAAIHEHGIVHRDLKSANIMVDAHGGTKILDFGIAKQTEGGTAGLTAGDRIFGTPEYMSPEQVEGRTADARSDVYALGCVVFEIFTGRPPFHGETPYATLLKHLKEPLPLDPVALGLPPLLLRALSRALAKDRNERLRSAADFIVALRAAREAALTDNPNELVTLPPAKAPGPFRGRFDTVTMFRPLTLRTRRGRWTLAAAAGVVVALGLLVTLSGGSAPAGAARTPPASVRTQPSVLAASAGPPPSIVVPAPTTVPPSSTVPPSTTAHARSRSETPTPVPTPTPRPPVTLHEQPAAAPRPSPADVSNAAPPSTVAAAPAGGTLALMIVPPAEVVIDGTSIGVVDQRDVPLPTGPHKLEVLHADYEPLPRRFTIRSSETTVLILDLAEKGIRKTIKPNK